MWASLLCQSQPSVPKLTSHCLLFGLDISHGVLVSVYPHTLTPLCSFIWCFTLFGMRPPFLWRWPNLCDLKIFLNPKSSTHTPDTKFQHLFYLPRFYLLLDFCLFSFFFRDKTVFFFSLFPLYLWKTVIVPLFVIIIILATHILP